MDNDGQHTNTQDPRSAARKQATPASHEQHSIPTLESSMRKLSVSPPDSRHQHTFDAPPFATPTANGGCTIIPVSSSSNPSPQSTAAITLSTGALTAAPDDDKFNSEFGDEICFLVERVLHVQNAQPLPYMPYIL
ncbi:hypothetical protein Pelo_1258 [Pelomyxa schiedti]|nr:hypothetical protein Pelo_1258 [Pelomyxa schiedti]